MNIIDIVAQGFGILGLFIIVYSFQCRKNSGFFLMQALGSFMFFINFLLIGAYAGALFNLTNLVRGLLFRKDSKKRWKLILTVALYTACFAFSIFLVRDNAFGIFISALPYVTLVIMSVLMWLGNGRHIRIFQFWLMSPSWIVHNIYNFSLGGIICECFNMISSVIALMRYKKEGFDEVQTNS